MRQKDIETSILLQNNTPLDDFCGLSPNQMYALIYDTFSEQPPVILKDKVSDQVLSQIPFFNLTEHLFQIIERDNFIKLTAKGALPRNVLHELYDLKLITEEIFESGISKLTKEMDSVVLNTLHINSVLSKIVKHEKGKLIFSKFGRDLIGRQNRFELFKHIFQTFTQVFNWGFNDAYPESDAVQKCWPFTIYLFLKEKGSSFKDISYYAGKNLIAFPHIKQFIEPDIYEDSESYFTNWYFVRTIYRFTDWFNLTEYAEKPTISILKNSRVRKTAILGDLFYLNE